MEPFFEVRMRRLLQTSTDFQNQISELQKLRDAVRRAEETQLGQDHPVHSPSALLAAELRS